MAADRAPTVEDDDLPGDDLPGDPPAPKAAAKPAAKPAPAARREPAPEPEPEPKKHTHTSRLTKLALEMGYTQADLDDNPSDVLWEDIERVRGEAKPTPAKPAPEPEKKPPADPDEEYLAGLAETHPELVRILRRATDRGHLKPVEELREKFEAFEKEKQERQRQAAIRAIDDGFDALPPKFRALFGEGAIGDLADERQKKRRLAVVRAVEFKAGDGKRAIAAKIAEAADLMAGDTAEPADPYQLNGGPAKTKKPVPPKDPVNGQFTAADFNGAHVHRPSGKTTGAEALSDAETVRRIRNDHGDTRGSDRRQVAFDDDDDMPE